MAFQPKVKLPTVTRKPIAGMKLAAPQLTLASVMQAPKKPKGAKAPKTPTTL
jgi:hypothetical protein